MGADVNAQGKDGTPLHCAAAVNNVSAVEALFEAGANIRAKDRNGRLPVFAAASNNANEVVEILTKAGTGLSAVAKFDAAVLSGLNNAEKGKGCLVVAALLATLPILFFCVTVGILVKGFGF